MTGPGATGASAHGPDYWVCRPGSAGGSLEVPGDKSVSHRAVMLAGIASGRSEIHGFLPGADCLATMAAMAQLGVAIEQRSPQHLVVEGRGATGLRPPVDALDLGNAGTGMRLLAGLLAGMPFASVLTGDESLSRRPMGRIAEPLIAMGADIRTTDGHAPLHISGRRLRAIDYSLPVASAQVKSALLLAGLSAQGTLRVGEAGVTRDHTERLLRWLGCTIDSSPEEVVMAGGQSLTGRRIDVPGDFSAAAFFIVAAAIAGAGELTIRNVGINPTRVGLLELLEMMGADISIGAPRRRGVEPIADIVVRPTGLRGIDVPAALVPLAIDEFPVFFVAAACARGVTRLTGAAELRVKESDRIAIMAEGLTRLGIDVATAADGLTITGGRLRGGTVRSAGDHRVAMAFAVAAAAAADAVAVHDVANVATSFPDFVDAARSVGLNIEHERDRNSTRHRD